MTVLVTGANGTTGAATLQALAGLGVEVRALVRDPAKLIAAENVEVAVGDFDDAASLRAALTGVDRAYLVGASSPRQAEQETAFATTAAEAGVAHLVVLSVIGAGDAGSEAFRFGMEHRRSERAVVSSGVTYTFLRPNGFLQNFLGQASTIAGEGAFSSSLSPQARVSYVDAGDIGAVAAAALTEDGHEGKAYTLTGPEALSDDDIAERMSAVLGRPVRHVQVPVDGVRQAMLSNGYPGWNVDGLVELFALYETGAASAISGDVELVLGRRPRGIDDFVRANAAAFAP